MKDDCYFAAKEKYEHFPSAYASGYIAKCRKKKGIVLKSEEGKNLKRWIKEEWVDEYGNECGSKENKNTKKCRPKKRISKKTPVTWNEMNEKEKKKAIKEKKNVGMGKRTGKIEK